ncbi:branched-chain amino acid aminotransferase [Candidatus Woesearchaeota archaeon]|nr:branched-chain amino acid aminotransferase [Candidatus Woesearchaeota archaeon]
MVNSYNLEDLAYHLKPKAERRQKPLEDGELKSFGKMFTDHMFLINYIGGQWINPRIVPLQPLQIHPAAKVLHYAQTLFEGIKAYMHPDDEVYLFRADMNANRLNNSGNILCMPNIPLEVQLAAYHALIDVDRIWVPRQEDASLYVRPNMFATQAEFGVAPSTTYTLCVTLSPSGSYYPGGFNSPVKLLLTSIYHRVAKSGTGQAKAGGNYAASLRPLEIGRKLGSKQVLFLDSLCESITETGAMNFATINANGQIVTPPFTDEVLAGITATSVLELDGKHGLKVTQKPIRLDEMVDGINSGTITEANGFGTAAVISSVGRIILDPKDPLAKKLMQEGKVTIEDEQPTLKIGNGEVGEVTRHLYDILTGIHRGRIKAPEGWLKKVERNFSD